MTILPELPPIPRPVRVSDSACSGWHHLHFRLWQQYRECAPRIGLVTCQGSDPYTEKTLSSGNPLPDADFQCTGNHFKYRSRYCRHGCSNQPAVPFHSFLCFQSGVYRHPDGRYYSFPYQKIASILKWLCLSILLYLIVPFLVKVDWKEVLCFNFYSPY